MTSLRPKTLRELIGYWAVYLYFLWEYPKYESWNCEGRVGAISWNAGEEPNFHEELSEIGEYSKCTFSDNCIWNSEVQLPATCHLNQVCKTVKLNPEICTLSQTFTVVTNYVANDVILFEDNEYQIFFVMERLKFKIFCFFSFSYLVVHEILGFLTLAKACIEAFFVP